MKKSSKLIALTLWIMAAIGIFYACRKMDQQKLEENASEVREKFFTVKPGTDPIVAAIAASIKRQDAKRNFVPTLTKKAGFALWDKAKVSSNAAVGGRLDTDDEQQVFIPFVQADSNSTKAILIVKLSGDDTLYHLMYGAHYIQYGFDTTVHPDLNSKVVFHWFELFDYEIFGHNKFNVTDKRLLNDTLATKSEIQGIGQSQNRNTTSSYTIWVTFMDWDCCLAARNISNQRIATDQYCTDGFVCNVSYYTAPVTFWFDESDPDEPGWYEPGGGGGGAGVPCPGCSWEDTNPCPVDEQGHALTICDVNWNPITGTTTEPFDPDRYDSITITSPLESTYPCIANIIRDSLANINWLAQMAGEAVFKDSAYMHLTFDTSTTNTHENQAVGETISNTVRIINGQTHFQATVYLNGWYLRNATKEYTISTIIHEAMHAIFSLRFGQYQQWLLNGTGTIDSNFMKTIYPIFWNDYVVNGIPPASMNSHDAMMADYINYFILLVKPFYNPAASRPLRDTVLKAIGYGGMRETTAWKRLPSLGADTCKYRSINLTAEGSIIGTFSPTGCPPYAGNWQDSLKLSPPCH